jgi:small subunit ribosomal protein S3Ae
MAEVKKTKVVDKWKLKTWYSVHAPENFESKEIGQVVATDEKTLKGRIIRIGLGDLTGSFSQGNAFTSVLFRVTEVKGKSAYTEFLGHELAAGYIKTMLRRRRSIIYSVVDVVSKDGKKIRLKNVAVTSFRVSESVRASIRKTISEELLALTKELDFQTIVQETVFGKLSSRISGKLKKITSMRRFEIRKSETM